MLFLITEVLDMKRNQPKFYDLFDVRKLLKNDALVYWKAAVHLDVFIRSAQIRHLRVAPLQFDNSR